MKAETRVDTKEAILSAARSSVQRNGYNALSYRDLAAEIGIKSASVHYHFPAKADLAEALVDRYREDAGKIFQGLADKSYDEAMGGYIALFRSFFDDCNQMCLGGFMSAEITALPEKMTGTVAAFYAAHIEFLRDTLSKKLRGAAAKDLDERAQAIFAALEGAQLIARGRGGDATVFDRIVTSYRATGLIP